MAFTHGKTGVFKVDNAAGTLAVLTTYLDSVEFKNAVEVVESTTMGVEAKTYLSGHSDATLSISGLWDGTASTGPDAVLSGLVGLEVTSSFEVGPNGSTAGMAKKSGEAFLTSYTVSIPVGGVVAFSADFQVTGPVTVGVWP